MLLWGEGRALEEVAREAGAQEAAMEGQRKVPLLRAVSLLRKDAKDCRK